MLYKICQSQTLDKAHIIRHFAFQNQHFLRHSSILGYLNFFPWLEAGADPDASNMQETQMAEDL